MPPKIRIKEGGSLTVTFIDDSGEHPRERYLGTIGHPFGGAGQEIRWRNPSCEWRQLDTADGIEIELRTEQ